MPQLAQQKIDRHRQLGRRQHFLADRGQHLLRRHVARQPLAQRTKEVGLLDVLLAAQRRERRRLRLIDHRSTYPVLGPHSCRRESVRGHHPPRMVGPRV